MNGSQLLNELEILRALYRAIDWETLFRIQPTLSREQVDELFRRLSESLKQSLPGGAGQHPESRELQQARLYCDGASSGNPGPAAIGMVLCTPDDKEVEAWGASIGRATNNVAEYRALLDGLARALELGVKEIEILSDSELLINQVNGRYKVRNLALIGLCERARELLGSFQKWQARHIPREQNLKANALAAEYSKRSKEAKRQ